MEITQGSSSSGLLKFLLLELKFVFLSSVFLRGRREVLMTSLHYLTLICGRGSPPLPSLPFPVCISLDVTNKGLTRVE